MGMDVRFASGHDCAPPRGSPQWLSLAHALVPGERLTSLPFASPTGAGPGPWDETSDSTVATASTRSQARRHQPIGRRPAFRRVDATEPNSPSEPGLDGVGSPRSVSTFKAGETCSDRDGHRS